MDSKTSLQKPASAKHAGILPAPLGATGSKPFEKKKDWKDNKSELIYPVSILSSFPKETSVKARVEALLDTSSLAGDFSSEKTLNKFNFTPTQTNSKLTVCLGLDNTSYNVNTKIELGVIFYNELLNNNDTFDISANILKR